MMDYLDLAKLTIKNVFSVNVYYSSKNACGKRANRSSWAFIQKYDGETQYINKGKKYLSNSNSMIIAPKGSSYEWTCVEEGHFVIIEFDCDEAFDDIMSVSPVNTEFVLNIINKLEHERIMNPPLYKISCMENIYAILRMLIKSCQLPYRHTQKKDNLKDVFNYIAENYNRKLSIDELASLTPYSTVYFRKLFTEMTGSSPISYIHELRIKKAKELLQSDYGSISDIAYSLGYANIYEFSRTFKKHTGLSPTHFLKVPFKK